MKFTSKNLKIILLLNFYETKNGRKQGFLCFFTEVADTTKVMKKMLSFHRIDANFLYKFCFKHLEVNKKQLNIS